MTVYDELVKKVNPILTNDTSDLVKKADYNTKFEDIDKKTLQVMINISLLMILLNFQVQYLMKD